MAQATEPTPIDPEALRRLVLSTGDMATEEVTTFLQRTRCIILQKPFELRALDAVVAKIRQESTSPS